MMLHLTFRESHPHRYNCPEKQLFILVLFGRCGAKFCTLRLQKSGSIEICPVKAYDRAIFYSWVIIWLFAKSWSFMGGQSRHQGLTQDLIWSRQNRDLMFLRLFESEWSFSHQGFFCFQSLLFMLFATLWSHRRDTNAVPLNCRQKNRSAG